MPEDNAAVPEPQNAPEAPSEPAAPGTGEPPTGGGNLQAKVAELEAQLATKDGRIGELETSNKAWQGALTWANQAGGKEFIEALHSEFGDPAALKQAVEQAKAMGEMQPLVERAKAIGIENAVDWLNYYGDPSSATPTPAPQPQPQPNEPQPPAPEGLTREDLETLLEERDRLRSIGEQKDIVAEAVAGDLRPGGEDGPDARMKKIVRVWMDERLQQELGGQRQPTEEEIVAAGRAAKEALVELFPPGSPDPVPTPDNPTPPELDQSRPGAGQPAKRPEDMSMEELAAAAAARDAEIAGKAGLPVGAGSQADAGPGATFV